MSLPKKHKEIIPIIVVAIAISIASYNLFNDQQDNYELLNSGTTIHPETTSGRTSCEVPIRDISKQQDSQLPFIETEITN